jgi:CHAT domain-containing protein
VPDRRRGSAESYDRQFQDAFVAWRWPPPGSAPGPPAALAQTLRLWTVERPEDAEQVQALAVGAAAALLASGELESAGGVVTAGLEASLLGALAEGDRQASAAWLALLGARIAFELDDLPGARVLVDRARETAGPEDHAASLEAYLELHRNLIEARLAEAALEARAARDGYAAAVDLAASLADGRQAQELLPRWSGLVFGAEAQAEAAAPLLENELAEAGLLAALGLARVSPDAGPARNAVDRCADGGLPVSESVLVLGGILERLPAEEIDAAADRLAAAAGAIDEPWQSNWVLAVRALQTDAWSALGDLDRAKAAADLAHRASPTEADVLALMLGLASRARERYAAGDAETAWPATELLLRLRADTAARLTGSRLELRARAACEPALASAVAATAAGDDAETRRRTAALVDALRAAEDAPPVVVDPPPAGGGLDRAEWLAGDRIGRLAYAATQAGDLVVLVVQSVGNTVFFVAVGADPSDPVVTTDPSPAARRGLRDLAAAAEQGLAAPGRDDRLVEIGRAAFDALPEPVRDRLRRASTIVVVPDLGGGRDRTPFELLHDGDAFLGLSKVVCRCLSLSHALRVVEPRLVSSTEGRRSLCVAVGTPPGLPPLTYAASEVSEVASALGMGWDVESLLESAAEPELVLELAPLADVLHLACHGDSAAGAEALVLGDGARLRAMDIATRHRLRGVAYLNACSLGRGRYVGGGLSRGVAYAFARAGAPAVVANLLPVADRSAADLAEAFYTEAQDHPVGEALRRARTSLSGRVGAALWSTTVLVGDPFRRLDGTQLLPADATSRLFAGEPEPTPERLAEAAAAVASDPDDVRLAAAVELSTALAQGELRFDAAARVARELGHGVGEAHSLLRQAESGDVGEREQALRGAIAALEPLRGIWPPAYEVHRDALAKLRSLDPAYQPRELPSFRFESGLTVNDRSDPAVDLVLRLLEAQDEHESFWRGEPALVVPDLDVTALAHNALVWGHLHRLRGTGAESAYALACAERLAWRGLVSEAAVPGLHRVWAGLLYFLWGEQRDTHLQDWMLRAHTNVLELAVARLGRTWTTSAALPFVAKLSAAFDAVEAPAPAGSRFARARAALDAPAAGGARPDELGATVEEAVRSCHAGDAYAAADLGAWVVGDLLERERSAPSQGAALAFRTLLDSVSGREEGWISPYLMEGFAGERSTGGMDVLARWSSQLV